VGLLDRLFGRPTFRPPTSRLPQRQVPHPTDVPLPQQPITRSARGPTVGEPTYRVKQGDTLRSIAKEVYGDEGRWMRLAEVNRQRLGEPPVLYPGMELDLPEPTGGRG
jgi:nucleoid-associated protein YgaU